MTTKPRPPHHNHITRDIKKPGMCPACDRYHAKEGNDSDASTTVEARPALYAGYQQHLQTGAPATLAGALNAGLDAAAPIIIAQAKAEALVAFADAHRMPWTMFMDDSRAVTIGELLREQAAEYRAGGIIGSNTDGLLPAHTCMTPGPGFPLGLIWQCLRCKKTYRVESVRDRGTSQNEWVAWTGEINNPTQP